MSRSATVTAIDAKWVAIVGATERRYKTRSGAVAHIVDELDRWIRWARFFDSTLLEPLQKIRGDVMAAHGNGDWTFTIAGMPGHVGLRAP